MERLAFIMAGGSGERFWPLSRAKRPKQLLRLTDPNQTLLEEAVRRIEPLVGAESVYVITAPHLQQPICDEGVVSSANVWAEPLKRNTLGALVWVVAQLIAQDKSNATLCILTADHKISDPEAFRSTVDAAMSAAEFTGGLVTCGVVPTRPETGYGYIELDRSTTTPEGAIRSAGFREKPDAETARFFVESGRFLWNSGMFFWTLGAFVRELEQAQPEVGATLHRIASALASNDAQAAIAAFEALPNLSVDYALMEKSANVYVVEATFGWDDVGAWDAVARTIESGDDPGSTLLGETIAIDCSNVVLYNEGGSQKLVGVGLHNLVAVVTSDAILLCPLDQAQRVKEVVERLKAEGSDLL